MTFNVVKVGKYELKQNLRPANCSSSDRNCVDYFWTQERHQNYTAYLAMQRFDPSTTKSATLTFNLNKNLICPDENTVQIMRYAMRRYNFKISNIS